MMIKVSKAHKLFTKKYKVLAMLLLFFSCTNTQTNMKREFENLFDEKFSSDAPGGVVLVKKGNDIVFLKSYGIENLGSNKKITPNTVFNTGSVSKTFVSNAILILEEEGLLSIEDNLYTYFKDFDNPGIAKKIKIKHLLTHTSGLPDLRKVDEDIEFYLTAKDEGNFEPLKRTKTLNFEPGEKFEYSNPAFNGLALIIEKVTQKKWQSFVEEKIFKPSGMINSKITDGAYPEHDVAHAYTPKNGIFFEDDYGECPTFPAAGNGGVWSSVLDLVKYEEALQNADFLSKGTINDSRNVYTPKNWKSKVKPDVGYSWFLLEKEDSTNDFGVKIVSHTGWQGGFRAFYISVPEKNMLYVGLFNKPISNLLESFNPFSNPKENVTDVRVNGVRILENLNWLD